MPPSVDRARLVARLESLRALAADTDGMAIVQTNDLERGFKRIVADLSSYYLLGYYSTRKMDGRFHAIRVRVKRPGVQVRARRGYQAPSAAEVAAAATRAKVNTASALDPAFLESKAVEAALAPLNSQVRERSLYLQAVSGWRPGGTAGVWAVGEVSVAPVWKAGADVDVMLVGKGGETIEAQKVRGRGGDATFLSGVHSTGWARAWRVHGQRARARPRARPGTDQCVARRVVRAAPLASDAILVRRGATTGNREVRTADVRFRRTDQLGVDMPSAGRRAGAGAPARPQRPAAAVAGHGGRPRRSRRIAVADGARVAGAACAWRLHARDDHGIGTETRRVPDSSIGLMS